MNSFQLLNKYTPGGSQTLSKQSNRYPENYPKVLSHGKSGHVLDEQDNEYIDLISGLGAISVGYSNSYINNKVEDQILRGVSFSLPTKIEGLVAQRLTELVPWTEQWRFGKTGTDGVLMAIRAARALTERTKILTFGYHGCTDHFECLGTRRAGMLDLTEYTHQYTARLDYSDESYAALVLEPWILEQTITCGIRDWCTETGTLLIADEVVTGGRFEGFTASSYLKIQPDIIVMGKGLANGFPLCAVGGTRRIMSVFERDDFFASGTFGGETVSLSACLATTDILSTQIKKMIWNGSRIQEAFNKLFKDYGVCAGYPTRLDFKFKEQINKWKFWQEMCNQGILIGYNNFIMADHTDEDITKVISAMFKVHKNFNKVEFKGPIPSEALRKN